jgi:hypothetical protein
MSVDPANQDADVIDATFVVVDDDNWDGDPADPDTDAIDASKQRDGQLSTNALTVWAALTLGFLAFVAFGSVRIHQWRWSFILDAPQEDIESVRLIDVWKYQASNLPDIEIGSAMIGLYYVSLIAFVGGCIVCTWLLLGQAGERPRPEADGSSGASSEA